MATRVKERAERRAQAADKRPRAVAKNVGVSPSKVRIVLNLIRGKDYVEALAILKNMLPFMTAEDVNKLFKMKLITTEELSALWGIKTDLILIQ